MTEPDTEKAPENSPVKPPARGGEMRRRILVVVVTAAIAVAGFVGVYGIEGLLGNENHAGVCTPTRKMAEVLKPRATGDMAGVILAYDPVNVSGLAFKTPEGEPMTLADKKGKVLLVNLWATWCAPCKVEMPALAGLQKELGGKKFEVVAINLDKNRPERGRQFLEKVGAGSLAFYADRENDTFKFFQKKGRARGLPATMLVDRKGCEIGTINGPAEWHSEDAKALVKAAISLEEKN